MLFDGLKYQESRMATEQEFTEDLLAWEIDRNGNLSKGGPVLLRQGNTVFSDVSDLHNLTVGDTGSMKTLRFVLPLLYSCGLSGESMIVVDPKGELVRKTSGFLQDQGYHNLIYLHTREISFLEYVSKLAGNNEYGRPLLSASRLQHLKKSETVIFHDRCYPFVVQDIPLIFEYPIKLGTELPVARKPILLDPPVEEKKKRKKVV